MAHSVLLVEDDKGIATVITEALREDGFDVTACESIARRDALLADNRFDVMLTDVMLEDGDGLASIDTVRRLAPAMPVIVLSAQNTLDTAVRASDSDAFEYFPKPFDLDELTQAVAQAVAYKGRRNRFVVEKPALLQQIETGVDARRVEALLAEFPPELLMGAGPVREQIEGGVAHADVRVGVEQMVTLVGGQGVPDTEPALFERFEHQLERFALVEVDEDFEAALPLGLDARDERVSGAQPARALLGILRACAGQKSERVDVLIEVGLMDAQSQQPSSQQPSRWAQLRRYRTGILDGGD